MSGAPGEWLAPVMFITVLALIFTGYPVAFSLGGTALVFAGIAVSMGYFDWHLMMALPERVFGFMSNYVLLAIPFFIFMGTLLEKCRLAEDLLKTIGQLFGPVRGGLAFAVVFVGTLLAAATGVIGASVVAMGMISLPVMLRYGYSPTLATGIIAAAGTLGQIIPPSVVLVVLGDQMGISVGDLFLGALIPGLLLSTSYAVMPARWPGCSRNGPPRCRPASGPCGAGPWWARSCVRWCRRCCSSWWCWAASSPGWPRPPRRAPWARWGPCCWPWPTDALPATPCAPAWTTRCA